MRLTIKKKLYELTEKEFGPFWEPWDTVPLDSLDKTELILIIKALMRKVDNDKAKILDSVRRTCSKD